MEFANWHEAIALLGGAVAAAFAIVRLGMAHQKSLIERLMAFLQSQLERQAAGSDRLVSAVEALSTRVGDNTLAMQRLIDRGDRP